MADRPESAEEGIGIRQEVLDKDNRKGQFRPSHKSKYHEENIERLAYRQFGDRRQQDGQDPAAGSLTLDDVLEEMYKQDTGLRPETMRHSVTLYHRVVMDLILNGYSVNTGLFRAVPQLKGVVEGGVWNKENNSIYVSFTQDKALREAIAKTVVEILGEKSNIMYILETEDRKTGLKDGSATAGHNFFVRGAMLKVVGDHESVGVTLTDSKGATTKLTDDQITINNPSSLTLLLPADLAEGEYTLTVTTQYGSAGHILKMPRSVSTQIWVGGKPADGGGDSESPDEI